MFRTGSKDMGCLEQGVDMGCLEQGVRTWCV